MTDLGARLTARWGPADLAGVDPFTLVFLIGGLVLIASEFVAPSFFTMFLGIAALLTAGLRGLGVLESVPLSVLVWSVMSLALAVPLRPMMQRLVPGRSEVKKDSTDVEHDRDAMGEIVEVVEDVGEDHDRGRIRFQGTTWQARMTQGSLKKGEKAQLVYRDGVLWIVEAVTLDGGARDLFAVQEAQKELEKELQEKQKKEQKA